ncbi:aminoglycoside acetyltransferase [Penicillium canariense]|uniref:Aminoglycoside acetyltransferase n=1 Tax=Penicillium canariense TaxID=189055 RepID=A0A9W9LIL3_9EURO|nr:aminoglycoside acetyltransferase [Penicillium canariense]KAJ5157393.1 aminoglycoside acetyltransferase [Penicillium canariense]
MGPLAVKGHLCTRQSLADDLRRLGIKQGDIILLHSSLSSLGWVCGGAEAVVLAFLDAIGNTGTLVVPTQSGDNSDPREWKHPPVPPEWHQVIRESIPAYDPQTTRTRGMGVIAETVRTWPNAIRSAHPQTSFTAIGHHAAESVSGHALDCRFGENSPLARLEALNARVVLLGVGFESCTAFHLAECRLPASLESNSFAVTTLKGREWMTVEDTVVSGDMFDSLGSDFEKEMRVARQTVGGAPTYLFPLREAVEFAGSWLKDHHPTSA